MKVNIDTENIRGVCHNPDFSKSWEQMEYELQCASRLNINSIRFWLLEEEWKKAGSTYINGIVKFVELCWKYKISVMPILWNGNFITNSDEIEAVQWKCKIEYAKEIIFALAGHEGVFLWDIINEPMWNDYLRKAKSSEYETRYSKMEKYTRKLCEIVKEIFPEGLITVGHEQVQHCESTIDLVDVISFHDYHGTRKTIKEAYEKVLRLSQNNNNKPILNTETGCIGRANPYDIELEMCQNYHFGWYLFNLVSEGDWGDIHGLIYPDGTIRDPAVIAAMYGFFRNRTSERIIPNPNREGHVYRAIRMVEEVLKDEEVSLFTNKKKTSEDILEAAEYCANILEACEMIPMDNFPSAQISIWRAAPEEARDIQEIRKMAFSLAETLKKKCLIL